MRFWARRRPDHSSNDTKCDVIRSPEVSFDKLHENDVNEEDSQDWLDQKNIVSQERESLASQMV